MTSTELRREIKRQIDSLPSARLKSAADFLAYLSEREPNAATEELLRIPGFLKAFKKAEREAASGKLTRVDTLKRKY